MDIIMNILHVVTAVFIIGPMAVLPMSGMRAIKAGQGGQVAVLGKSTFLFSLLSLLVVFFGFGVMGMADKAYNLTFTTPWILISIVLYAIALILNLAVVVPAMRGAARRLQEAAGGTAGGNGAPAAVPAAAAQGNEYTLVAMGSGISSILLLVIVILMVWKP